RDQLANVLALIHRAMKPGGAFYASYKAGEGDGRDTLDRYYNYPTEDWLRATYAQSGTWNDLSIETGEVRGFDDAMAKMFFVLARKGPLAKSSKNLEDRQRQHGLRKEADGEGQRAEHR